MQSLWPFLFGLLVGAGVGAIVLARSYMRWANKPENARVILRNYYKTAHKHWLQKRPDDPTRVCPCCGWSEDEGKDARENRSSEEKMSDVVEDSMKTAREQRSE